MQPLNLVLLGPPGSGKGTQGERLQSELGLPYFATGDILRAAVREQSDLGRAAQEHMDRGDLVPDALIIEMIAERLTAPGAEDGFILDGFPRTLAQAEALERSLGDLGRELSAAVLIDVPDREVVRRLSGRRVCPDGHIYHVEFDPPREEGICDTDGKPLEIRDDDRPEVVKRRLEQYHEKTEPLVGHYESRGLLHRIDGTGEPGRVTAAIRELVGALAA